MKYFSMFSGIGGFELGIQQAYEELFNEVELGRRGQEENNLETTLPLFIGEPDKRQYPTCIGYSEIDKYAIQVYEKHFNHKNYGDCTKIITSELPDFDLLVGGFPCQAFSIAGKRRGFDEARGTLFFDIARILADKRPRNFILENVKGLLSHDGGCTFTTIIRILSTMGYFVEWQVLNAKNFGVPQNRERVFIVGHLGGQPRRKVFPIGSDGQNVIGAIRQKLQTSNVARCLTSTEHKQHGDGNYIRQINNPIHSNNRVYGDDGVSPALNTMGGGNRQPKITIPVLTPERLEKRQNGRRFKEDGEPSFTITKTDIHGVSDGMRIRRLTPLECERLMSYPDNWTLEGTQGKISDTQRYKMCGNGIVSNIVKEIIKATI